jgi:hypothetical protein
MICVTTFSAWECDTIASQQQGTIMKNPIDALIFAALIGLPFALYFYQMKP